MKRSHDGFIDANRDIGINRIVGSSREIKILRKDGEVRWGSFSISKVEVEGQLLYTAFVKDVTESLRERRRFEMLSLVADRTNNAIFIADSDWRIIYINQGFRDILGYEESDVFGQTATSVIAPNFDEKRIRESRAAVSGGTPLIIDELVRTRSGKHRWCSVVANPVFDEAGRFRKMVVILSEITHAKLHEVIHSKILEQIARDEPLEVIMESACCEASGIDPGLYPAIFRIDPGGFLQLLAAPGHADAYKKRLDGCPVGEGMASSGTAAFRGESVSVADIASDPLWDDFREAMLPYGFVSCRSHPVKNNSGEVLGVIAFSRKERQDPTELEELLVVIMSPLCALALEREAQKQSIRELAYYDSLTKFPNRSLLHAKAEQALREASASGDSLAILFLDLDRFKEVNDARGRSTGDLLLKETAGRIRSVCRNGEIFGRLSGDEFVVVAPGLAVERLNHFVEDLKAAISSPVETDEGPVLSSASIGISLFPEDGHDVGTLLHRAERAMFQVKESGLGKFAYYSHELNKRAQEKQRLEAELRAAIGKGQLELVYQPQVLISGQALYGVEALSRWYHPEIGTISPGVFIPLAEECGLIHELSAWVLREACAQMAQWRRSGTAVPRVSLNLSPASFHDIDISESVFHELRRHGLESADLTLELTEGVVLDTNPNTIEVLHRLHDRGISLSIDDFGTGYSSLSYLQRIPIKEIKLDRSFVTDLERDKTSRALSEAVLQIGRSLGLDVVAEGIEDARQLAILEKLGYQIAQGFLFSRPLSPLDLEAWLRARGV